MDIYYPPKFDFKRNIPAVVFVFGYTNEGQLKTAKHQFRTWSIYTSWCKVVAASGIAAIVYETINPGNEAIKFDPNNMGNYYYRGLVKIESGDKNNGCLDLKKAAYFNNPDAKEAIKKYCQ